MAPPNFLIIGASGRTGRSILHALAAHPSRPVFHAFVRTPSKLPPSLSTLCHSVQQGDATNNDDIHAALQATQADVVIVSLGVPNSTTKTDVRERSAIALEAVLRMQGFDHVRVVVVSMVGAGGTRIVYGWGLGMLTEWMLSDLIPDHDRQEEVLGRLGGGRVMVVRPMGLGDGGRGGGVVEFEGRAGSMMVQRDDLAEWVVDRVVEGVGWGQAVNVTGKGGGEGLLGYVWRELVAKKE